MGNLRIALAQINSSVGDLRGNARKIIRNIEIAKGMDIDIIAFPELAVTGYPPEDLLMKPDELQKMWILRKILHPMDELAAMEFLYDKLKVTKTNDEFFQSMKK